MTDADWRKQKARELWPQADAHRTDIERALEDAMDLARANAVAVANKLGGVLLTALPTNTPEWMEYRDEVIKEAEAELGE